MKSPNALNRGLVHRSRRPQAFLRRALAGPLFAMLVLCVLETHSLAANRLWTGLGGNDFWSTDANWDGPAPGAGDSAQFINSNAQALPTTINNIVNADRTVDVVRYLTTGSLWQNTQINSGVTLTVNGFDGTRTLGFGQATAGGLTVTQATLSGDGTLLVSNSGGVVGVGSGNGSTGWNQGTVDMSGLATFTASLGTTGVFRVGDPSTATNATTDGSWLVKLATNTTITAGTLDIGSTTLHTAKQTLKLGSGAQTINANTISIATLSPGRSSGEISFNSGSGTVKIRSASDPVNGSATLNVANVTDTTSTNLTGLFDVTGHSADVKLGTVSLGNRNLSSASTTVGPTSGVFSFDNGTLDIASVNMGIRSNNNNASNVVATLNIGGGTVNIGSINPMGQNNNSVGTGSSTATLNVTGGDVTIGAIFNMAINGGANGAVTATLNFTGGTIKLDSGNIRRSGSSGSNAIATLNLDGATLDMDGHEIGGAGGLSLNNVLLKSGTIKNVAQINNGADIAKTTGGTLVLDGTNSHTGATNIEEGELVVDGTHLGGGAYTVDSGARLGGNGTIGSDVVVSGSPGSVSPGNAGVASSHDGTFSYSAGADGDTVGHLMIDGNLSLSGHLLVDIVDGAADLLEVDGIATLNNGTSRIEINGLLDLTQLNLQALGFAFGQRIDLLTATSISNNFGNFPLNETVSTAGGDVFIGNDGQAVYLQLVPEPTAVLLWTLIGAASIVAIRLRKVKA